MGDSSCQLLGMATTGLVPRHACPPALTCVSVPSVPSPVLGTVLAPSWQLSTSFSIGASGRPWMVSAWGDPFGTLSLAPICFAPPALAPLHPAPCTQYTASPSPKPLCSAPPHPALVVCTPVFCTPTPSDPAPLYPTPPAQLCTPQNCTSELSSPKSPLSPVTPTPAPLARAGASRGGAGASSSFV